MMHTVNYLIFDVILLDLAHLPEGVCVSDSNYHRQAHGWDIYKGTIVSNTKPLLRLSQKVAEYCYKPTIISHGQLCRIALHQWLDASD